jgi:hypothetical protein
VDLSTSVAGFKDGSAFANPIADVTSSIAGHVSGVVGSITIIGYISGTTMTVISATGTLANHQNISGVGITTNTTIITQTSGATGDAGNYTVSPGQTAGTIVAPITISATPSSALQTLMDGITTSISAIQESMASFMRSLPVTLPLMNAADNITKTLQLAQGIMPASGAGANFSAAFAPMTSVNTHLSGLQESLAANSAGLAVGDPAAIAAAQAAHDVATSSVTNSFASSAASQADSIGTLKAYSFTKMCASPQTDQVSAIMNQGVTTLPSPELVSIDSKCSAAVIANSYAPVINPPIKQLDAVDAPTHIPSSASAPPTPVCGLGYDVFKSQYMDYTLFSPTGPGGKWLKMTHDMEVLSIDIEMWKTQNYGGLFKPSYDEIKLAGQSTSATPTQQETYAIARANILANCPAAPQYRALVPQANALKIEQERLLAQWEAWMVNSNKLFAAGETDTVNKVVQCDPSKW